MTCVANENIKQLRTYYAWYNRPKNLRARGIRAGDQIVHIYKCHVICVFYRNFMIIINFCYWFNDFHCYIGNSFFRLRGFYNGVLKIFYLFTFQLFVREIFTNHLFRFFLTHWARMEWLDLSGFVKTFTSCFYSYSRKIMISINVKYLLLFSSDFTSFKVRHLSTNFN